jgi:hypothetical protein
MFNLPSTLRQYADFWDGLLAMRVPNAGVGPRTESIYALLEIVKWFSGKYHYNEVADLLNVMDMAYDRNRGGTRWDATNLKQLQFRARKRFDKLRKH